MFDKEKKKCYLKRLAKTQIILWRHSFANDYWTVMY